MEEFIAGKHAVLEAMRSGRAIHKLWIAEQAQRSLQPVLSAAKERGIFVQQADKRKLDQLVGKVQHQGVVAQAAAYEYANVEDILEAAARERAEPLILILDEVEDPHNLGSILRTAACTGVHGVIIPKRRAAGLTAAVAKTSAGAAEYVPVARVSNIAQTIDQLKKHGVWIAGTDVQAESMMYTQDMKLPLAIVIGNEHKGISRLTRDKCDFLIRLPMRGPIQSLNASVAAGVVLYEAVRQRRYLQVEPK